MKFNGKIFSFVLIISLIFLFIVSFQEKSVNSEILFLDVGQGDAILIQNGDRQILIDGGRGSAVIGEMQEFMPLYDRKIDLVILTHPDQDHLGGLLEVLREYEVDRVLETGVSCEKKICKEWNDLIREKEISSIYAKFGQEIMMEDTKISVIYPFEDFKGADVKDLNDSSIIMKVEVSGETYLLTGDATSRIESELVENNIDLKSDVLKIGHHGSKYSSSFQFLKEVSPSSAVISVGKNSYGHPAEEVLNRLNNMNIDIFRTDKQGSLVF